MKRVLSLLCLLVLVLSFAFTAFSADIDGIDNGAEWDGAAVLKLLDGESNCNVNFGLVKAEFDNESSAVFFSFMFIDPMLEQGNENAGISLSIEDSEPFVLTMSSTPFEYDVDKYSFSGAMSLDENNGATCEVRIGIKYGLRNRINGTVRFIDSNGAPSNFYDFSFDNEGYVSATEKYVYDNTYSETVSSGSSKTTNYKVSTKKETTHKASDDKNQDNNLNLEFIFDWFTEPETESKTAASTRNIDITERTKFEPSKSRKESSAVTAKETAKETTAIFYEDIINYETQDFASAEKDAIPLSMGSRYKIITGAVCGLALVVIAALGTYKFKNDRDENDPKQ